MKIVLVNANKKLDQVNHLSNQKGKEINKRYC